MNESATAKVGNHVHGSLLCMYAVWVADGEETRNELPEKVIIRLLSERHGKFLVGENKKMWLLIRK